MVSVIRFRLAGKKFGRWTVLYLAGKAGPDTGWYCRCECGTERIVASRSLRTGKSACCGCVNHGAETLGERSYTHGMTGTQIYMVWGRMIQRCHNPRNPKFKTYGKRGIKVCKRWRKFENFFADMTLGGSDIPAGLSIDRIDNSGDYKPGNCRWATLQEQANNRSNNHRVTYDGITQNIIQWSVQTGIGEATIRRRIKSGWPLSRVFTK